MPVTIQVKGMQEIRRALRRVDDVVKEETYLKRLAVKGARYAQSISPVQTGSYRSSHQVEVGEGYARIGINPSAINRRTGARVTSYAPSVERRHGVYRRTAVALDKLADVELRKLAWQVGNAWR